MEINKKRPSDSRPAPNALSSAPNARPRRPGGSDRHTWQRWVLGGGGALSLCALFILAGCPGNLEQPERFEGTASMDPTAISACMATLFEGTKGKCSGSVCHTAGSTTNDLDLSSPGAGKRLVNVTATHSGVDMEGGVTCPAGVKLVDTSNPMASWLLAKINGTQGSCGTTMPQVGTLTSTEKACITNWVQSQASDAGTSTGGSGAMSTGGSGGSTAIAGTGGAPTAGGSGGAATSGGSGGATGGGGSGGAHGGASGSAGTGGT